MTDVFIDRNQAFGVKLTEGDVQGPLILSQGPQTIRCEVDAFADADSRGTNEPESIRRQTIGSPQFQLQELVLLERKRSGKIARLRWEVFAAEEVGWNGTAVGRQTLQDSPEANEIVEAGCVAQQRILFAQPAEPAEKMRIAAQLREAVNLREGSTEIGKEAAPNVSIFSNGIGPQAEAKRLDMRFEDLFEAGAG